MLKSLTQKAFDDVGGGAGSSAVLPAGAVEEREAADDVGGGDISSSVCPRERSFYVRRS